MAIVYDGIECPICKKGIDTSVQFFSSFAFEHPLSDAAMHWECFLSLPDVEEFLEAMFNISKEGTERNPYWKLIDITEGYLVSTNGKVIRINIKCSSLIHDFPSSEWPKNLHEYIACLNLDYLPGKKSKETIEMLKEIVSKVSNA